MSLFLELGSATHELSLAELAEGLHRALDVLGKRSRVLAVPPDFTRYYSRAGELTAAAYQYYGEELRAVLPAVGTHAPVSPEQREKIREWIKASIDRQLPPRFPIYVHFLDEIEAEMIKPSSR